MKYTGTYSIVEENYVLVIEYEYYWDQGDYYSPPEDEFTITEVLLNGEDITDFYWDWVDDSIHSQVYEYAREHAE